MSTRPKPGDPAHPDHAGVGPFRDLVRRLRAWGVPRAEAIYAVVGLWLALAFVVALLALWGFLMLAGHVTAGATMEVDRAIMLWLNAHGTPTLDKWGRSVTELGSWIVTAAMAMLVSVFLWVHGQRRATALLWIGLLGVFLLDKSLKDIFDRVRPDFFEWRSVTRPTSYSFPSGHTLNATVAYTLFAFLVARLESTRRLKIATFIVAGLLIFLVALSRVYLGVHYPSDVLAGMLVGFTWAMACVFAVYVLRDLRAPR